MTVTVRDEAEADRAAVRGLVADALGSAAAKLVDDLRTDGALISSLAAFDGDALVGYVAASRLEMQGGRASVLAPLAAAANHRRRGIANRPVTAVLEQRRAAADDLMLVLGDPAFYGRFDFEAVLARPLRTPWDGSHQQAVHLSEDTPQLGSAGRYPRAFAELD